MPTAISLNREVGDNLMAEGLYRAKIEKVEEKQGPSGFPYLSLSLRCFDPANNRLLPGMIWDNVSLSPQARFRVEQLLDSIAAPSEGQVNPPWFEGKTVWLIINHDEYNGKLRNHVDRYVTPDAAQTTIAADDTIPAADSQPTEEVRASQHADVEIEELEEEEFPV